MIRIAVFNIKMFYAITNLFLYPDIKKFQRCVYLHAVGAFKVARVRHEVWRGLSVHYSTTM